MRVKIWDIQRLLHCVARAFISVSSTYPISNSSLYWETIFQETKLKEGDEKSLNPADLLTDVYPYRYFSSSVAKKGYAGTAMLCKIKPIDVMYGIGKKDLDQEGRVITAEFDKFFVVTS